ncbi:MAG TPA: prolyl oligopeptidase family serine peptidase [Candidatus Dormibacteraeota bacterium]
MLLGGTAATILTACAPGPAAPAPRVASPTARTAPTPRVTPVPLPPYAIATLRQRPPAAGQISVGAQMDAGAGFTKYHVTWVSDGSPMTGVLDIPAGGGRFPVVIVNHGYAPVDQYYVGLDTAKYADPMASAGFLTISPDYPGYSGSGPGASGVPSIDAEAISDLDLISELATLPQADPARVAVAGHSNGGGVAEILMAARPSLRAAVLYAPVSTDMADNARKWWVHAPGGSGAVPDPDTDPAAYRLMSPRPWFGPATPPVLIMQGTVDEDIPAAWTAATVSALQAAGAHSQFVSFPGASHIFGGADLDRANTLAIDWLRSWMR